ncbi:MAG: TolC family protein [Bacteroidales bacterium]|nr:TolC family protein [Bacteroidales bacterium]
MKIYRIIAGIALLAMVSSCSLYNKYQRPTELQTDNLYGDAVEENGEETFATLSWRELYTDPCLQALIDKALANNTGVKVQQWAVESAKASLTAGKLGFLPSLNLNPEIGYTTGSAGSSWGYKIPLALTWEIDIFGSKLSQKRMAGASYQAQLDLQQAVKSRLIATVASKYYQLIAYDQIRKVIIDAIAVWNNMITSSEALMENGYADAIAVSQFKGQSYDFQANLHSVDELIAQGEIELCALLCEPPHSIERSNLIECPSPQVLKTGLSSQLLANRPDVRQAESELAYFYHDKQHALSNYFPKFTISAEAAFNGQFIATFLGSLLQPIFAQGKIAAEHKAAKARYEQAKLNFQQKLIDASDEVVLALNQCTRAGENFHLRTLQVAEYEKAVEFSRTLMFNGERTYLDVLIAETNLIDKQQTLINDRLDEMLGIVNLYLALGGGHE